MEGEKSRMPVQKVSIQGQSLVGTLFGMELRGKQIISGNGTSKWTTVIGFGGDVLGIIGFCVKAVHEVEIAAIGDVAPNRVLLARLLAKLHLIPAHLRDFESAAIGL